MDVLKARFSRFFYFFYQINWKSWTFAEKFLRGGYFFQKSRAMRWGLKVGVKAYFMKNNFFIKVTYF